MHFETSLSAVLVISLCLSARAIGQITFETTFGGVAIDQAASVEQTADGGYILAGSTSSFGAGQGDIYLIRTDPYGQALWSRTYGGGDLDAGYSARQTMDGGFVFAGLTYSFGAGAGDVYLVKTDSSGDTLWTRTFGSDNLDWAYSVRETPDGGYIVAGSTTSFGAITGDAYVIRTDSIGEPIWARGYGGYATENARSVCQTTDGGFIFVGSSDSYGAGLSDVYLVKTDSLGYSLWYRTYGREGTDHGFDVQTTLDGGYIIAGEIYSPVSGSRDAYLIKTDGAGDTTWTRTYGGSGGETGSSVAQSPDGRYVMSGYTESTGAGGRDVYLVETTSLGIALWSRTFGGSGWDWGRSVSLTSDGGYVIAGETESYGAGERDAYLVKTDADGVVEIGSGTPPRPGLAEVISLCQNYPNPFNPSTTITFEIPGNQDYIRPASLTIYDPRGRRVRELLSRELLPGINKVHWDGRDDRGRSVPSGAYLYRLKAGDEVRTRKMTILR